MQFVMMSPSSVVVVIRPSVSYLPLGDIFISMVNLDGLSVMSTSGRLISFRTLGVVVVLKMLVPVLPTLCNLCNVTGGTWTSHHRL